MVEKNFRVAKVAILLSTYNGEEHLEELLDSLLSQNSDNWTLFIRDDGSSDNTLIIIESYHKRYFDKINVLVDDLGNIGSTLSFATLLQSCNSDYIMLCDQDDIWLSNKIDLTLNIMLDLEKSYENEPLMVFTDLKEVDNNLHVISESFIKSQKMFPEIVNNYIKLLALNVVAGCTMMINRVALDYVLPIPSKNIIHDQWIAVNISKFGHIKYLPYSSILYRQHASNVVGANNIGIIYFLKKMINPFKQFRIYYDLISNLTFRINVLEFVYYKLLFTYKRLL